MSDEGLTEIMLSELWRQHEVRPATTTDELVGQLTKAIISAVPKMRAFVIEALAAEAESHINGQQPIGGQWGANWAFAVSFLRAHLPASDPEAGEDIANRTT